MWRRFLGSYTVFLGLVPFALFATAFEVLPIFNLVGSSLSESGSLTLKNFSRALTPTIVEAFQNSLLLSFATASIGTLYGAIIAYAIVTSKHKFARHALTAVANVTANFGGAPLAFACIVALGSTGFITILLKYVGLDLYPYFRIYSITGLGIAYLYFQTPLAILLLIPAIHGLRLQWREAAEGLGASSLFYWMNVGIPILAPAVLSCFFLLFANAFGAYATAWTLTGSDVNLVPVQIGALVRGEVKFDPALADALAVLSLLVIAICLSAYKFTLLRMRLME